MLFDYLFNNPLEELEKIYNDAWKEKGEENEVQNRSRQSDDVIEDN